MNRVPDSELVHIPGGSLLTTTPEEGRALALAIARHTIHNIQPDLDVLKAGRPNYAANPEALIAAGQVVAIEFQTIAAANNYWRRTEQFLQYRGSSQPVSVNMNGRFGMLPMAASGRTLYFEAIARYQPLSNAAQCGRTLESPSTARR